MKFKTQIPEGVQDFLPGECAAKRAIEGIIRKKFTLNGYNEVDTPAFEYLDVFSQSVGGYYGEQMIKFLDSKGRILVLRPDITLPIARMSGGMDEDVLRLFYISNAYAAADINVGQRSEYTQAGAELIGRAGAYAECEIMATAIDTLISFGLTDFKLDIGQVEYFKGIATEAGLNAEQMERIRLLIDEKNTIELEYELEHMNVKHMDKLLALPSLFGGRDALIRARALAHNERSLAAVENIERVFDMLCTLGFEKYLSIDFGMVHKLDYYTGIVFRGLCSEIGFPILSGGRYDNLHGAFGADRPAVGFALGIKRVMIVLERKGMLEIPQKRVTYIAAHPGCAKRVYELANERKKSGETVIFEVCEQPNPPKGASEVIVYGEDGMLRKDVSTWA